MKTSNGLSLLQRKLLSIIAESQCLLGKLGFNFFLDFYALHFIQWALGGTIKCLKSLPIKEKCIECLDSLIHFSSVAMHHFDWSLLHFWTPLQYWFFCLLQLDSCLVVNCTSMIYSPLHCLVVLNLSAVSALGLCTKFGHCDKMLSLGPLCRKILKQNNWCFCLLLDLVPLSVVTLKQDNQT